VPSKEPEKSIVYKSDPASHENDWRFSAKPEVRNLDNTFQWKNGGVIYNSDELRWGMQIKAFNDSYRNTGYGIEIFINFGRSGEIIYKDINGVPYYRGNYGETGVAIRH
jgi:hypothetical protein